MKLLFRQRFFSWFDSYDIYNESGDTVYVIKGKLSWGHCLKIYDCNQKELGTVKERVLTFLPKFEMYIGEEYIGCIKKKFTFFIPKFSVDCKGWQVDGNVWEWDYSIQNEHGERIATISKQLFHLTDTYEIDILHFSDALEVLMLVLAIDAEKCSRNKN